MENSFTAFGISEVTINVTGPVLVEEGPCIFVVLNERKNLEQLLQTDGVWRVVRLNRLRDGVGLCHLDILVGCCYHPLLCGRRWLWFLDLFLDDNLWHRFELHRGDLEPFEWLVEITPNDLRFNLLYHHLLHLLTSSFRAIKPPGLIVRTLGIDELRIFASQVLSSFG